MMGTERSCRQPPIQKLMPGSSRNKLEQTRKKVAQSIPRAPPRQAARPGRAREGVVRAASRISIPPPVVFPGGFPSSPVSRPGKKKGLAPAADGEIFPGGIMRIETRRLRKFQFHHLAANAGNWTCKQKIQSRVCRRKNRVCPARSFTFLIIRVDTTPFPLEVNSTVRE